MNSLVLMGNAKGYGEFGNCSTLHYATSWGGGY